MNYNYLILLFLFTLVFRSLQRAVFKNSIDFDTYFHLYLISFIRKEGVSNLIDQNRFIKPFKLDYPWMMHYVISRFDKKFDLFFERFFNPILDSFFLSLLYILTTMITNSNEKALILSILYIFTPVFFTNLSLGPRIKSFTPRLFGEVVGGLMFVFQYMYILNDNILFFLAAIFCSFLSYLSSKFSVQAILFINLFIYLFTFDIKVLLVVIGGFILALVFTKGKYIKIIMQQLEHLRWFFLQNLQGKMSVSNRNSIKIIFYYLANKKFKKIVGNLLFQNTFFIVLTRFPLFYISLFLIIVSFMKTGSLELIDYYILASLSIFFISSLKWFLFIGEAERYLNYLAFFILYKSIDVFTENLVILVIFIFYGLFFYILDFYLLIKREKVESKDKALINWINKKSEGIKVATIPYHLGGWKLLYLTNSSWLYHLVWIDKKEKNYLDNNYVLKYPFLDISKADEMIERYKLDFVIYDKESLEKKFKDEYIIPSNLKQLQISENIFALYK